MDRSAPAATRWWCISFLHCGPGSPKSGLRAAGLWRHRARRCRLSGLSERWRGPRRTRPGSATGPDRTRKGEVMLGGTRAWLHFDDQDDPDVFDDWPQFAKGEGFIWSEGQRYRVADTWWSFDHHGRMA